MQVQKKTKQDQYQETLEAAKEKGQRIKKIKVNESKQCIEGGLQE